MITLRYGLPGTGKTTAILGDMKRDAENGIPSFLIVPEQETVSAERRALLTLPPSAQLSSEVLNFSRLANRVFREYGGLSYHTVDKGSKALLMWKNLRGLFPLLEFFTPGTADDSALASLLLSAVAELKASSVSSASLDRAADKLPEEDPLRKKLRDLSLIYASYSALLASPFGEVIFDDKADDLSRLSALLGKHAFFKGTHVYIDSFTSFTSEELTVIGRIAEQADALTVSLAAESPTSRALQSGSIVDTAKRLRVLFQGKPLTETFHQTNFRAKTEELRLLSSSLWQLDLFHETLPEIPVSERGSVSIVRCRDLYREVESAALRIARLVRSGYRYRDIVLVTRDASELPGILELVFPRYGIPYYLSEKEDLISLPPLKLLLSALRILSSDWQLADVIAYLKTGLSSVDPADADLFEEYVTTWEISGDRYLDEEPWDMNPDGFVVGISPRARAILDAANRVKGILVPPVAELGEALRRAESVPEQCDALRAFLVRLGLEEQLRALSLSSKEAGQKQAADIFDRLYDLLLSLLNRLALLFSTEEDVSPLSEEDLAQALRILLENTDIGTIPTAVDEVTVGSANMLRTDRVRCAILIGLCEGVFPAAVDDSGLLSSPERERLASLGVGLSSSYPFRASDELLYVSRAVSSPSERLILSYHTAGTDGRICRPSLAYLRVKKLLPYLCEESDDEISLSSRLLTPESALDHYAELRGTAYGQAIEELLGENGILKPAVEAANVPVSDPHASVSPALIEEMLGDRFTLSQTRLEKYVTCHFGYYCSYILSLREKKRAAFGSADAGSFIHRVLEQFFRSASAGSEPGTDSLPSFTKEEIEAIADRAIAEYEKEILPPSLSLSDNGRLAHLYRRLRDLSVMMISNILKEFSESDFVPRFFELKLGASGAPTPLAFRLKDGSVLSMPGIIDRVDLCRKDNKLYVRVVDYKTGTKDFSLSDLDVGLNLQMLIYLFSICHASRAFPGSAGYKAEGEPLQIVPAGALYHSSALSPLPLSDYPDSAAEDGIPQDVREMASKKFVRSGVLPDDEEVLRAMNHNLDPAFLAGVKLKKDGLSGSALIDRDGFEKLETEIRNTVSRIAGELRRGEASATPLLYKGKSPCDYCEMRPVCRKSNREQLL